MITLPMTASLLFGLSACGENSAGPADAKTHLSVKPSTAQPPWPAPADVETRVEAAGLDLGPMGTAEHYHPQLSITIGGRPVGVPAGIGVDPASGAMSALHTHESDGTLHVEADRAGEVFTLGQLFTQWGVALNKTQVGGVQAADGDEVLVTVNGRPIAGDPRDVKLAPDQRIAISVS